MLEEFSTETPIGYETVVLLANSLSDNTKMKKLVVKDDHRDHHIGADRIVEAFSRLICNNSSIMATYESNHTLQEYNNYIDRIKSMLQVNKNSSSPAAAARSKIIKTHFSDVDVKQFVEMDEEVYPHAAAWMAKDIDGLSLLYKFLTSIPLDLDGSTCATLLESSKSSKKQKLVDDQSSNSNSGRDAYIKSLSDGSSKSERAEYWARMWEEEER